MCHGGPGIHTELYAVNEVRVHHRTWLSDQRNGRPNALGCRLDSDRAVRMTGLSRIGATALARGTTQERPHVALLRRDQRTHAF